MKKSGNADLVDQKLQLETREAQALSRFVKPLQKWSRCVPQSENCYWALFGPESEALYTLLRYHFVSRRDVGLFLAFWRALLYQWLPRNQSTARGRQHGNSLPCLGRGRKTCSTSSSSYCEKRDWRLDGGMGRAKSLLLSSFVRNGKQNDDSFPAHSLSTVHKVLDGAIRQNQEDVVVRFLQGLDHSQTLGYRAQLHFSFWVGSEAVLRQGYAFAKRRLTGVTSLAAVCSTNPRLLSWLIEQESQLNSKSLGDRHKNCFFLQKGNPDERILEYLKNLFHPCDEHLIGRAGFGSCLEVLLDKLSPSQKSFQSIVFVRVVYLVFFLNLRCDGYGAPIVSNSVLGDLAVCLMQSILKDKEENEQMLLPKKATFRNTAEQIFLSQFESGTSWSLYQSHLPKEVIKSTCSSCTRNLKGKQRIQKVLLEHDVDLCLRRLKFFVQLMGYHKCLDHYPSGSTLSDAVALTCNRDIRLVRGICEIFSEWNASVLSGINTEIAHQSSAASEPRRLLHSQDLWDPNGSFILVEEKPPRQMRKKMSVLAYAKAQNDAEMIKLLKYYGVKED